MAQVNLSILKITGDENDYLITDETARSTASQAQSTASQAQSTASQAQSTAEEAQSTAEGAQSTASNALSVANSKLLNASLDSQYTSTTKTLTLSLITNKS